MATVTLTLTDTDLETGKYKIDFNVEESRQDHGQFTAAHLTGAFVLTQLSSPQFLQQLWDFAEAIAAANPASAVNNNEYRDGDIAPHA